MKIKVTDKSYEKVLEMPPAAHQKPAKQSAFFRFLLKTLSAGELKATHFEADLSGLEEVSNDTPCLILMNHSSFTDLQIAATILANRSYHIVCTNDGFIGKEGLMRRIGCIPTRKFISDMGLIRDMKYALEELHSSVLMFPEASYSFDGTETPLPDSLGKCLKVLKVPVIMIRTTGAFLRDPLYNNLQKRSAKVTAVTTLLLTPAQIQEKNPSELNQILADVFRYDHFREQAQAGVKISEPFRADGLHRVLYKCPSCMTEGKMEGKGIYLTCKACGKVHLLSEDGRLNRQNKNDLSESGGKSFDYVPDWYAFERDCVRQELLDNTYRMEMDVDILILSDLKSMYRVGEGHLTHTAEGFHLTGCQGKLDYRLSPRSSYSLYADYYWYEIGDMISIGDHKMQYYCFPKDQAGANVAKARLATEELFKLSQKK